MIGILNTCIMLAVLALVFSMNSKLDELSKAVRRLAAATAAANSPTPAPDPAPESQA